VGLFLPAFHSAECSHSVLRYLIGWAVDAFRPGVRPGTVLIFCIPTDLFATMHFWKSVHISCSFILPF